MGQEWAASSPFLYFTDLEPALGRAVTEGRRREFNAFPGFDPDVDVPDPQAESSFQSSRLHWDERAEPPHASSLALYKRLLALRAAHPALQASDDVCGEAWAVGEAALVMRRTNGSETFLIVASFREDGEVGYAEYAAQEAEVILTTEDPPFAQNARRPQIHASRIRFERAGAVVLRSSVAPRQ
jgi:maltooligosyltrehalose trehalohydrolase